MDNQGSERKLNQYKQLDVEREKKWNGPFYFVQGADCQFGLIARYIEKKKEPNWDQEKLLSEKCVEIINSLDPEPKFFVICGDLCDAFPETWELRKQQENDFYKIFNKIKKSIPLVCVCGNHDVGDQPTVENVSKYRSSFGDDYFSFWAGGVFFIVLNSQYYHDGTKISEHVIEQDTWLEKQLEISAKTKHGAIVFQHIPLFLKNPEDKSDEYFCLNYDTRKKLLEKLYKGGVRHIFCGHYHRNCGGYYKELESVVTSAIGGQLGSDKSGFRIVKVYETDLTHEYKAFEDVKKKIVLENNK